MSQAASAREATPAHLLQVCRLRLTPTSSRSGANPSLNNPQNQTPDTLLLNAHQMCTHKRRAQPAAHLSSHCAFPGARATSTLPSTLQATPRDTPDRGAQPHRHENSSVAASSRVSSERAGGERVRGPAWAPAEALRGASAQCCPSPGADRAESRSRLSNRRRPRVVPAGGRILRRKTREGRVGGGRLWIFCSPEVWDLPRFFSPLSCFLQSFPSVLDFGAKIRNLSGLAPIPHLCERI
jgi:hypothetical protein